MRQALASGHHLRRRQLHQTLSRAARAGDRRQKRVADDVLHARAGDGRRCCSTCGPGDEVIMPVVHLRLDRQRLRAARRRPVFVDIRADTLNLDERSLEAAITPRTRAIVVVHYAGVACEMDAIIDIAARHGLRGRRRQRARAVRTLQRPAARLARRRSRRSASTRPRTSPAARAARC